MLEMMPQDDTTQFDLWISQARREELEREFEELDAAARQKERDAQKIVEEARELQAQAMRRRKALDFLAEVANENGGGVILGEAKSAPSTKPEMVVAILGEMPRLRPRDVAAVAIERGWVPDTPQ